MSGKTPISNGVAADGVVSPSKITDYFEAEKSKEQDDNQEPLPASTSCLPSSVYLTPDSSPGKNGQVANLQELEEDAALVSRTSTEPVESLKKCRSYSQSKPKNSTKSSSETKKQQKSQSDDKDKRSTQAEHSVSRSGTESSTEKCKDSETTVEKEHMSSPIKSQVSEANAQSRDVSSASPSIPRPKLRRGRKHGDKVAASADTEPVKAKSNRRKKKDPTAPIQTTTITDFFPVRRSERQTKSQIEKEKQNLLEDLILTGCENGLKIHEFGDKGRGVVATKNFDRGDFVVEYAGDLLNLTDAEKKEEEYGEDPSIGCYMYYFRCGDKQYCVDATAESGRLGRLINHSRDGNLTTRTLMVGTVPRLILVAGRDIKTGDELCYDYGDRNKASLEAHPWLKL